MSGRLLITQSLLSSWKYQFTDFFDVYDDSDRAEQAAVKAREDFMATLRRESSPTTEAQQRGHDFEELVVRISEGQPYGEENAFGKFEYDKPQWAKWFSGAMEIAKKVQGGAFQVSVNEPLTIGRTVFLLHGRLDVLKQGVIYDIKFSSRYEYGNYFDSAQHPMYFALVPEAKSFSYLVFREGYGTFEEPYRREDTRSIADIISEFMEYLDAQGLTDLYRQFWIARD
jgi:hypothetical protein